ncbi:polysaccharide deacetylase family protein [Clostridium sp. HBUAS56017]|uniref:polysaccharide deacetylase family protein n=1 Tax=Clostridium sp. HBUAS56017 TaxID=2571128 RepID=UPI001178BB90|nr:polysaccharide deacetylase family protein [Clostridium sp. HBUAS56017]
MKKIQGLLLILIFTFATLLPFNLPTQGGKNIQIAMAAESYSEWNANTIYNTGNIVSYGGKLWIAQWWTLGQTPGTTGQWGVWKVYDGGTTNPTGDKLVALTFDDGPSNVTALVLDKLQKHNVPASFFLIGSNITDETKSILERELKQGCEINNHSWSHSYMNEMSGSNIKDEIQKTSDRIFNMVGVRPKFFRPPYIAVNNTMYENIDMPFICGINCTDWDSSVSAQSREKTILSSAKDGDIILLHDLYGNTQTVDALDGIIKGLQDKRFKFVTVSDLFKQKGVNPNVEYKIWTNVNK